MKSHSINFHSTLLLLRLLFLYPLFLSLTISIAKQVKTRPHQQTKLDQFLHAIHQPISIGAGQKSTSPVFFCVFGGKLGVCLREGALVGDGEHAHPATENAQRIYGVEGLRAAGDLGKGEGAALGGAHGTGGKRDPVDLVFEDGSLFFWYWLELDENQWL